MVENSLPLEVAETVASQNLSYQILTSAGQLIRKGCISSAIVYISTVMLPKGEHFVLRIHCQGELMHEGAFQTLL